MRNMVKIPYGPAGREMDMFWKVKVTDAARPVIIDGALEHALRGQPGVTIGCAMSNAARANAARFPHPVHLVHVTKNRILVVDKLKADGSPGHAVRYAHAYSHIVDANDDRILRRMAIENPGIMERPFSLRPPPRQQSRAARARAEARQPPRPRPRGPSVARGALARAVRAGRIGPHVARQLNEIASSHSRPPVG